MGFLPRTLEDAQERALLISCCCGVAFATVQILGAENTENFPLFISDTNSRSKFGQQPFILRKSETRNWEKDSPVLPLWSSPKLTYRNARERGWYLTLMWESWANRKKTGQPPGFGDPPGVPPWGLDAVVELPAGAVEMGDSHHHCLEEERPLGSRARGRHSTECGWKQAYFPAAWHFLLSTNLGSSGQRFLNWVQCNFGK